MCFMCFCVLLCSVRFCYVLVRCIRCCHFRVHGCSFGGVALLFVVVIVVLFSKTIVFVVAVFVVRFFVFFLCCVRQ